MTIRQEVQDALLAVNTRIEGLRALLIEKGDTPLATGTWKVRDALCHLAARSTGVPNFLSRMERLAMTPAGSMPATAPAAMNIDEINAAQVAAREGRSVAELLDEIVAGHNSSVAAVANIEDEVLARIVPNFRGEQVEAASMLLGSTARHDNNHLDEIEPVLR